MTELQLFQFVRENDCEYHWFTDYDYLPFHKEDVMLFVFDWHIEGFKNLLGATIMAEEGIPCNMKDGYFCFKMKSICEFFDIDMNNVFKREDEK